MLSASSGGALLAFASADAMLLTEHDLGGDVSRLQGRRAWIRARAVVVFERSRPLEGARLRVALVATSVGLPLISTQLSEMVSPSRDAVEVVGRFALMAGGAALSGVAVFAMLALFLSRQIFSGVIVSLGVVSLIILAWDVALYDSDGHTVRSVERMAQLWLAYPMLAVSIPLIVFGFASGVWRGRRGLILDCAVRFFVRQERQLRLSQRSVNPSSPRGRLSSYAIAAVWTTPVLPVCAFFAARAFDEVRSKAGTRGGTRAVVALIVSVVISALFLAAFDRCGNGGCNYAAVSATYIGFPIAAGASTLLLGLVAWRRRRHGRRGWALGTSALLIIAALFFASTIVIEVASRPS